MTAYLQIAHLCTRDLNVFAEIYEHTGKSYQKTSAVTPPAIKEPDLGLL